MPTSRIFRRLERRPDITEIKFYGNFSRRRIAHEIERIRTRIPDKRMQVLLPYETWKPGSWFRHDEDASLFSLLDHYDESQVPIGGSDPDRDWNRFNRKSNLENRLKIRLIESKIRFGDSIFDFD
jgi:hypothetical protein